jgi:hypothetical protein
VPRVFGVATTALLLSLPAEIQAADGEREPSATDVAAAQALFERARALMAEHRAEEACPLFAESQRLDAGLGTQYNLATCYEAVGRFASAYTLFLEVAAAAKSRGQGDRAAVARARAGAVESKLSRLAIEVAAGQHAPVTVERNGSVVGAPQWGLAVPLDPGSYRVTASGAGLVTWSREVKVGSKPEVHVLKVPVLALARPLAERCDDASDVSCATASNMARAQTNDDGFFAPPARKAGLATLGVGVAGLTVGTVFALRAHSKNQSSENAGCDERGCPDNESLDLRRQALRAGDFATVGFGVGIAGIAATGILFWALPHPDPSSSGSVTLSPALGPGAARLDVRGQF